MIYSKARIEFSEETYPGGYNTVARESGTIGDNQIGVDIGEAAKAIPRPTLALAQAIVQIYSYREDTSKTPPILKACQEYVKRWKDYDEAVKNGADPTKLEWPG